MEIVNETPWDTGALTEFLLPLLRGVQNLSYKSKNDRSSSHLTRCTVSNHRPLPGTSREEQKVCSVHWDYQDRGHLKISILSPGRAKVRTDVLDRLSLAHDLKPHEIAIPSSVLAALTHQVASLSQAYGSESCRRGSCECAPAPAAPMLIKGNLKTRTTPIKSLERLQKELRWAEGSVEQSQTRLDAAVKRRDNLRKRVAKRAAG